MASSAPVNESGAAVGARRRTVSAIAPTTAGPTPRIAARTHSRARQRSSQGRIESMSAKDGRKMAAVATVAPATPATL